MKNKILPIYTNNKAISRKNMKTNVFLFKTQFKNTFFCYDHTTKYEHTDTQKRDTYAHIPVHAHTLADKHRYIHIHIQQKYKYTYIYAYTNTKNKTYSILNLI